MKRQNGFTLIEIVIVIIILGLLAATALPKFLDLTSEAEDVAVEGIAGGYASAVGLVRAQWEVAGRPAGNGGSANQTFVNYDLVQIGVDGTIGYPSGDPNAGSTLATAVVNEDCLYLINNLFQQRLRVATTFNAANQLYVRVDGNVCFYHQTAGLAQAPTDTTNNNGFTYSPATGQVELFLNKVN
ncbi:prepilin-type N-terminal cleavage/methylation domain-containing protein [Arsukibacterium sp.]|uniref:prepilin-type N-terminal cleavage/methylation domain-containing protein n=1 Tax=Arsukibacterium sp. TaxID=1977258 RepID=UPI00299E7087|nr:prepilin-type N-terminal cleavage/methylation domain-containing protein [Arsukibacterium sp.]MDX1677890.1 prepilin-type N-terminal cleavage/methylation domain-containing protein [Arsukibacterium sp.]